MLKCYEPKTLHAGEKEASGGGSEGEGEKEHIIFVIKYTSKYFTIQDSHSFVAVN